MAKKPNRNSITKTVLFYITLIGFTASLFFNIKQCEQNAIINQQYLEQIAPEIDCNYKYFTENNTYKFHIQNVGKIDCVDIWAIEEIFLINEKGIYEGFDVPRFHYLLYEGSREKIWDIKKDSLVIINLPKYQILAFNHLKERFGFDIVSKWSFTFSSPLYRKRFQSEKLFKYIFEERLFTNLEDNIGGRNHYNMIQDYIYSGTKRRIMIFDLTGDFEIDAPRSYLINSDYSITPLFPWTKISIKQFNESLLLGNNITSDVQISDDNTIGSIFYTVEYKNGIWSKGATMSTSESKGSEKYLSLYSKVIPSPIWYLNKEEHQKFLRNQKILKYYNSDREIPKGSEKEIIEKAKIKYIKDRSY